jgi:hypothetical protein
MYGDAVGRGGIAHSRTQLRAELVLSHHIGVSGIYHGRPFRGNYRLVFDNSSLTYSFPKNMPDEIKAFAARSEIKP